MALELRPNCEYCDCDLPANALNARISTYECTFCAECVENKLQNVCPNCGGGFVERPIRPVKEWRKGVSIKNQPASTKRRSMNLHGGDLADHIERIKNIPPHAR